MQLSYQIAGAGGGYVVIYDEASAILQPSQLDPKAIGIVSSPDWRPAFKGVMQNDDLFNLPNQSGSKFRQALGNVDGTVRAKFVVPYKTRQDATASIRIWAGLMQTRLHFKLVEGGETQYYPNAVVESYEPDLQGLTVVHTFSFVSDLVTSVIPQ